MYNKDYYERGLELGVSGYQNYRWLPELTIRMAHCLAVDLAIPRNARVLDYGCAKGFLVKAFRLLDINSYGVDISDYAIEHADSDVRDFISTCTPYLDPSDLPFYGFNLYHTIIAKDVFEHMPPDVLRNNLNTMSYLSEFCFFAVPLAEDGKYIIPDYERDVTHIIRENSQWWLDITKQCGWEVISSSHFQRGVKDNWFEPYPMGNLFIHARSNPTSS